MPRPVYAMVTQEGLARMARSFNVLLGCSFLSGSCSMEEYQCHNGDCIPQESACDFIIHCSDYSDEDERYCCGK